MQKNEILVNSNKAPAAKPQQASAMPPPQPQNP